MLPAAHTEIMQCEMDGLRTLALILSVHFLFNTRTHFAELGSDLGPLGHLVKPRTATSSCTGAKYG